jgi:hypothetical protein
MTDTTSMQVSEHVTPTPNTLDLQNRFRANREKQLRAEKGDWGAILPGIDNIPEHLRFDRLRIALQEITREQANIIHALASQSTGPRKKTTTVSPDEKKAKAEESKKMVSNLLEGF